jgi:hypothetical protein
MQPIRLDDPVWDYVHGRQSHEWKPDCVLD